MSKADFSPKDQLIVAQVAVKGAIDMIVAGKTDKALAEAAAYIDSVVWRIAAETGAVAPVVQAVPDYEPDFADLGQPPEEGGWRVQAEQPRPEAQGIGPGGLAVSRPRSGAEGSTSLRCLLPQPTCLGGTHGFATTVG